MAVAGDEHSERWIDFEQKSETTVTDTYAFICRIIHSIGPSRPLHSRLFTVNNLLVHRNPTVIRLIIAVGHRVCFRAPYYPVDGTIEYVFIIIQRDLEVEMADIKNSNDLRTEILILSVPSLIFVVILRF